jgi:hypothetical protein
MKEILRGEGQSFILFEHESGLVLSSIIMGSGWMSSIQLVLNKEELNQYKINGENFLIYLSGQIATNPDEYYGRSINLNFNEIIFGLISGNHSRFRLFRLSTAMFEVDNRASWYLNLDNEVHFKYMGRLLGSDSYEKVKVLFVRIPQEIFRLDKYEYRNINQSNLNLVIILKNGEDEVSFIIPQVQEKLINLPGSVREFNNLLIDKIYLLENDL